MPQRLTGGGIHRPSLSMGGLDEHARYATSADEVRAMRRVLDTLEGPEDSINQLPRLNRLL